MKKIVGLLFVLAASSVHANSSTGSGPSNASVKPCYVQGKHVHTVSPYQCSVSYGGSHIKDQSKAK